MAVEHNFYLISENKQKIFEIADFLSKYKRDGVCIYFLKETVVDGYQILSGLLRHTTLCEFIEVLTESKISIDYSEILAIFHIECDDDICMYVDGGFPDICRWDTRDSIYDAFKNIIPVEVQKIINNYIVLD